MSHWRIKSLASGEVQTVTSLDGISREHWTVTKLSKAPAEPEPVAQDALEALEARIAALERLVSP